LSLDWVVCFIPDCGPGREKVQRLVLEKDQDQALVVEPVMDPVRRALPGSRGLAPVHEQ